MVYMDNAATTQIDPVVLNLMKNKYKNCYGNPSSLHKLGSEAENVIRESRQIFAVKLNAHPHEIYFTSGGSEADNMAILSAAYFGEQHGKKHIISSKFEHHAVLHTLERLREERGFEITLIDIPADGVIMSGQIAEEIRPDTCLVSIMYANNEIGTIQPIEEIGNICMKAGILFHTDAVQAAGHVRLNVETLNVDYLTMSAHKFHGPKGVGVLYARQSAPLRSMITGGSQEFGLRAGTENVPAIYGSAIAFEIANERMFDDTDYILGLRKKLVSIVKSIPGVVVNGHPRHCLPGILSVCFRDVEGESLLLMLNQREIYASAGSACTAGDLAPSHVLKAMGYSDDLARGALRLSLSHFNTMEDVEQIATFLPGIIEKLRLLSSSN